MLFRSCRPSSGTSTRFCAGTSRTEKGRGTITETFAAMATELAREYKFKALQNSDYASGQYALDMSRERLYAETDKRLK